MHVILLLYLLFSLAIFKLPRWLDNRKGILLAIVQFAVFVFFILKLPRINNTAEITEGFEWIPDLGLHLIFTLDGLSMLFALLITGIGGLVFLYAHAYMKSYRQPARFYFYLFLFAGAMLGLVLSGNLIQLFVFWELTSFLSFFLISFYHEKASARKAAFQSLFITVIGGLCLLAGIILLGSTVDSYSIHEWIARGDVIREHAFYLPGLILILIGVFTKSAQFPFHFWLPGAMLAPAPVSSFLHSATMVKAGFFLLARLNPVLGGTPEWTLIIPMAGVLTMLTGSYLAITQTDIKSILAYTTINALGILVLLIGVDTRVAIKAALLFLFVHAFYKASLFMIAGFIEKRTGTRDIQKLGGLIKKMPVTFSITLLVLLSMAGLPPMLGFLGKELIYEAKIQLPGLGVVILVLGVLSNVLMVAISLLYLWRIFLGREYKDGPPAFGKSFLFLTGPAVLALFSLFFGLYPGLLGNSLIESAMRVVHAEDSIVKLKLWHGFNEVFFLSLSTVITGLLLFIILYKKKSIFVAWHKLNSRLFAIRLDDIFANVIARFVQFSDNKTKLIQHGYHRYYILTIIVLTTLLLGVQIYLTWGWEMDTRLSLQPFYITGLISVIILSTLFSALSKSRIATIIAMGVTGYGISLVYLFYSAVDLAITQILAETLMVIVFVLVLQRLPRFARLSSAITKLRDLLIAALFGGIMTILALKAINLDFHHPISDFFLDNSYSRAFGKNVVNVILVDFRALDTLGEIIVLTVAALGVVGLIGKKSMKT
jgi:multicomponent Na+:H+ antiporter subunit A